MAACCCATVSPTLAGVRLVVDLSSSEMKMSVPILSSLLAMLMVNDVGVSGCATRYGLWQYMDEVGRNMFGGCYKFPHMYH